MLFSVIQPLIFLKWLGKFIKLLIWIKHRRHIDPSWAPYLGIWHYLPPFLCKDTYLTNKHNYLIKWGSITQNNNIKRRKSIKTMDFCHKEDILTPHGPHNSECGATYPHSYLNQCTYLSNNYSHLAELPKTIIESWKWIFEGNKRLGYPK